MLQVIALRIRALRKAAGLTQEQLSEKADIATHYVSRLENARQVPSIYTVVDLARALNVAPWALLAEPEQEEKAERMNRMAAMLSNLTEEESAFLEGQVVSWASQLKSAHDK